MRTGFSEKFHFDHEKVTNFQKKIGFIFSIFFQKFQSFFNIALNLTFGHIQPLIPVAETEGQKLKTFDLAKSFGLWYTTGGHVIQANGRLTFEDDLRSGGLLHYTVNHRRH